MQWTNSKTRYGAVPQALHWLTALFVICGWLLGQFHDALPRGEARAVGLFVHMTLGQWVAALLIARLIWRVVNPPPPLEAARWGRLVRTGAKVSHYTLYVLLVVVPILGIAVQFRRGHPLPVLGVWHVNSFWPADRTLARTVLAVHMYLADALLILAAVHACAALTHHWLFRDRTLLRMLPARQPQ